MPRYAPVKGCEDVRVKRPSCGHEMILIQICGGGHGPTVGHWWDDTCAKHLIERAGNSRCIHENPGRGLNDPPLQPVDGDVLLGEKVL
jgi:hypothetical protein